MIRFLSFSLLLFAFLSISSCQKNVSVDSLRQQLHDVKCSLLAELEFIERSDQLDSRTARVSELFEDLAECMLSIKYLPQEIVQSIDFQEDKDFSEKIHFQYSRILSLPGGEDWLIRCQMKAVRLLDRELYKTSIYLK